MLAIICALDIEFEQIRKHLPIKLSKSIVEDYLCARFEQKVVVVQCGVGKDRARQCVNWVLNRYHNISLVVSAGIAGALHPKLRIGDIVLAGTVIDYSKEKALPYISKAVMVEAVIESLLPMCRNLFYQLTQIAGYKGRVLSSDAVVNDQDLAQQFFRRYNCDCVEMESAGIAAQCVKRGVPFLAAKTISDHADHRAILSMYRTQNTITANLGILLAHLL